VFLTSKFAKSSNKYEATFFLIKGLPNAEFNADFESVEKIAKKFHAKK
jgi:hypothetical protein